jgi:hypothetical protein
LIAAFLANFGLTIFGDRVAAFFTIFLEAAFFGGLFLATFLAAAFTGFFADVFALFFGDFLNNLLMATLPPEGAKVMAWPK